MSKFAIDRILTAALLVALAVYALTGFFMRPEADDVYLISLTRQYGVLGTLTHQYNQWQGRYSYILVNAAGLGIFGTFAVQIMPALLMGLLTGVLYHILKRWVRNPLLAALAIVLSFIATLPNVWQSLYWFGSSSNYILPLTLGGWVLLWLWR